MAPLDPWQFEFEGLLLDVDAGYDVVRVTGLGMPDVRGIEVARLDDHGAFPTRKEVTDHRVMDLTVQVIGDIGDDIDTKIEAMGEVFKPNDTARPFRFNIPVGYGTAKTSDDTRRVNAYVRRKHVGLLEQRNVAMVPVDLQLVCVDPRIYDDIETTVSFALGNPDVGRTYDRTYDVAYGGGQSGVEQVNNIGNFATRPVATINGPCTNPRIENVTVGRTIQVNISLAGTDSLTIDFDKRTILLNGTASRYNSLDPDSQWWDLVPGLNEVRYAADSFQGQSSMDLVYRSAWM